MEDKLIVSGVHEEIDGNHPCDILGMLTIGHPESLTNRELHRIKKMTGILAGNLFDAINDGDMMENAEIGDVVDLTTDWISGLYFIEGISASCAHGNGTIPDASVTYDLSPKAHWDVDPF